MSQCASRKLLGSHQAGLDANEITNFNSLKLNIKWIWRELDSDKAFCRKMTDSIPRCLVAVIAKGEEQKYKEDYQNKV